MPDIMSRLREVSAKGDPAHQEKARVLLASLDDDPHDKAAVRGAELLIDAYLNDPYLTR